MEIVLGDIREGRATKILGGGRVRIYQGVKGQETEDQDELVDVHVDG